MFDNFYIYLYFYTFYLTYFDLYIIYACTNKNSHGKNNLIISVKRVLEHIEVVSNMFFFVLIYKLGYVGNRFIHIITDARDNLGGNIIGVSSITQLECVQFLLNYIKKFTAPLCDN